jgi:beta-galactosidase
VQLLGGPLPRELIGWEVFNLPLDDEYLAHLRYRKGGGDGPGFYRGRFELGQVGDTFLDLRGWGKGMVWVNGHNLGRYWRIGPQQTLYCPGPWLKRGRNEVVVFELNAPVKPVIAGLAEPVLGELETSPAAGSGAK